MYSAKQILTLLLALLLSAGTVCAQVCDISCALQGEPAAAPSKVQPPADSSSHCHGQAAEPTAQDQPAPHKKHHSSNCVLHGYAEAVVKSGKSFLTETFQPTPIPVADLLHPLNLALDRLGDEQAHAKSYRSPPARKLTTVLRI